MRLLPVLLLLVLCAGCECGHPGGSDAGDAGPDASAPCPESAARPACCQGGCFGDLTAEAICDVDAGTWVCPAGSVSPDQCGTPFCAGDQVPPLCEKQLGVCAGSRHHQLPDGGIDPVCDYGPNYEERETRCDGLDNDCDGETDRWWSYVLSFDATDSFSPYLYDVLETDGGFVYVVREAGEWPVLKYTDWSFQPSRPDIRVAGWDAGLYPSPMLVRTADGVLLTIDTGTANRRIASARLDGAGVPRPGADGGAADFAWIALPFPGNGGLRAASLDGTQVLHVLGAWTDIYALLSDAQGNPVAGPTLVMSKPGPGGDIILPGAAIAIGPDRFLFVAYQDNNSMSYEGAPVTLRVQELGADLTLQGIEHDFRSSTFPHPVLHPPTASGAVPMMVGSTSWSDPPTIYAVRWISDVLDAGYDAGTIWASGTWGDFFMDAKPSGDGFELVWENMSYESDGLDHWSVWDESVRDAGVNLNPGGAAFLSPAPRPADVRLRHGRPGTWVAFVPNPAFDGGVELRAVTYCKP